MYLHWQLYDQKICGAKKYIQHLALHLYILFGNPQKN